MFATVDIVTVMVEVGTVCWVEVIAAIGACEFEVGTVDWVEVTAAGMVVSKLEVHTVDWVAVVAAI